MASIKIKFCPSPDGAQEGTICYQINHERKSRQVMTVYRVFRSEWDEGRSMVRRAEGERCGVLERVREGIRRGLERLMRIVRKLDEKGAGYSVDDVVDEYMVYLTKYSLVAFMEGIIVRLKRNGKVRTSETYTVALNSFKKFMVSEMGERLLCGAGDIMLDSINGEVIEAYEAWQRGRGISKNTISFYMRILRAAYNRGVAEGVIDNRCPFKNVYTGVDKTVKRALPLEVIKQIKALDLAHVPSLDFARDMFMMSFMLRGMSFVDMAFLRKSDLMNGYLIYRRRKTGQQLKIKWTREMQVILDKYPENSTDYLLPIIKKRGANERCAYRNAGYNINHNLKTIAKRVGVKLPLTLYVARHSWASVAKAKGIPLSVISEGMGHDSEATTQIYLASLDTKVVDRANSIIMRSLNQ